MNDKGVYRTAPFTPVLLIILSNNRHNFFCNNIVMVIERKTETMLKQEKKLCTVQIVLLLRKIYIKQIGKQTFHHKP